MGLGGLGAFVGFASHTSCKGEHFGDAHAASWDDLAVRGDIHFDRGAESYGLLEADSVGAGEQDA